MGKVALVTGIAGFIGSHVAEALSRRGYCVVGVDNFDPYYPRREKELNLEEIASCGAEWVEADIRDERRMQELFARWEPSVVVHLAAKAGVRRSMEQAADYMDVNVRGTCVLLEAARVQGVEKFVFASSSSVYGAGNDVPFRESQPVATPISPYAASKIAGEALCYTYHHLYGVRVICLRLFTVYGPRQRPDLAINKFVRKALAGEAIELYGDGSSSRDYTYIADIVDGICRAVEVERGYEVINLGSGRPVKLMELVEAVRRVCGVEVEVRHLPPQPGDMPHTWADISKAQQVLGWEPKTTLDEGLEAFVEWFKQRAGI